MLYNLKILLTSSLKFLSSLYLSSASPAEIGLFHLGPTFCALSAPGTAMACIAALVAFTTAWAIASLAFVCSLAIMFKCIISVYVCLCETFTTDTM